MLQRILSFEDIWPGGIPSTVRPHLDDNLSEDDLREDSKGWSQFVQEEWVSKTDLKGEMQHRRALIERWASADQAFRDSYHRRAPLRDSPLDYPPNLLPKHLFHQKRFVCLALVDREQHSENYKRLLKVLILLYNHENRSMSHPMSHYTNWDPCHIPATIVDPSSTEPADDPSFRSYRNLLVNYYLHPADFRAISMTRSGTIIFPKVALREFIVIDQESLNEGRLAMVNFKFNGQLENYALLRPMPMGKAMLHLHVECWSLGEVLNGEESDWAVRRWNKPIDIDQPLIGILNSAHQRGELIFDEYSPDDWARQLEDFAPGYLDLEAQDREADYDLTNLWDPVETYALNAPRSLRLPMIAGNLALIWGIDRHTDDSREYSLGKFVQS